MQLDMDLTQMQRGDRVGVLVQHDARDLTHAGQMLLMVNEQVPLGCQGSDVAGRWKKRRTIQYSTTVGEAAGREVTVPMSEATSRTSVRLVTASQQVIAEINANVENMAPPSYTLDAGSPSPVKAVPSSGECGGLRQGRQATPPKERNCTREALVSDECLQRVPV